MEEGKTENEAIRKLAKQLVDYAQDYFKDFNTHFYAPNLKPQFPQVIKALVTKNIEDVQLFFDVKYNY